MVLIVINKSGIIQICLTNAEHNISSEMKLVLGYFQNKPAGNDIKMLITTRIPWWDHALILLNGDYRCVKSPNKRETMLI